MRSIIAAVVAGPLMLVGALPAAAGRSTLISGSGAAVHMTAADDSTVDRDTYTQKARNEVRQWQQKLRDLGDQAEAKGKDTGNGAENDLNKAWAKTKAASRRLQTVGSGGWKNAQASYERASRDLAKTWRKVHPEDK